MGTLASGMHEVVVSTLAMIVIALMVVWQRERPAGLPIAALGYALALAFGLGWPGATFPVDALLPRCVVAFGVVRYLGTSAARCAVLLGPPLMALLAPPTLAVWALPYLDLVLGLLCLQAARRERGAGHGLLAVASLAGLATFAVVLGGSGFAANRERYLWPATIAFGLVLPLAAMMREHRLAQTARVLTQRLTNFYDALSRTNQAIAHTRDRKALFEAICRICVDAGHARMACVYVLEGPLAHRAATAGPAAEILSGIPQPWDTSQAQARGSYTVQALESGRPLVSNDYQNDPRAAPWRAEAVAHGVYAFAWLPFHRSGGVDGVLMLAAGEPGFFDEPLCKLLEKLVGDISLALDAIDQEHERERAQHEVRAGLARFQQLFNAAPLPSTILSIAERRVVAVNDACCASFGLTREQMLGRRTVELPSRMSSEDREAFYAELKNHGKVRNRLCRVDTPGGPRFELFNAESIDYQGQPCMLVLTLDITDLQEAEQVREALARAEAASRAKTEFLSRMSHELRTPLNAVLGFAQLLRRRRSALTAQELRQLDLIRAAGWHLLALINDVLDMSRIEAGNLAVQPSPVTLAPLLDEAVQMSDALARRQGVTIHAAYRQGPAAAALADPTRMRQVVLNLLSNAIKYNRPGGSVRLAVESAAGRVCVVIEDTGLGMTHEQLAHLYEPFNRLGRERGAAEGTGIGLILTRQLLLLMRGDIEVESVAGHGTRVRVTLPQTEPPALPGPRPDLAETPASPHGTVLYIEDNEVNALLVEQLLARWGGVRFVHAPDGRGGVDLARTLQPALVLLDMQLPDLDGLEVLRQIKAEPATRHLRVVALSASAMPADVALAKDLGVEEYWTKPLAFERFLRDVARLMNQPALAQGADACGTTAP